jgi:retron-type reverse transcriptase
MNQQTTKNVSEKQQWLAKLGKECPQRSFPSLMSCIDLKWLYEAYRCVRKSNANSLDQQAANHYAMNLQQNLQALLDRLHAGRYRPPSIRPLQIARQTGCSIRPNTVELFEDEILQQAVAMLLEPLYEQDFLDCSYGQRPGRSAQQALSFMWRQLAYMGGGWVVELSIESLRDNVDAGLLLKWLGHRVSDPQLIELIEQWLQQGLLRQDAPFFSDQSCARYPIISSILLNLYLHEVLDSWFERNVKKRLHARAFIVRYNNSAILGFGNQADARRVMMVLPRHFSRYGMELRPTTTRMVQFLLEHRSASPRQPSPSYHLVKQLCA